MSNLNRISVKVEVDPEDSSDLDTVAEAFDEALYLVGCSYEDVVDKFFTMRFDETAGGGIAATVSIAEKRD